MKLSLRGLRSAMGVADCRSVSAAAVKLNRTQSAVSKAISELEAQLDTRLFDRFPHGMEPTAQGTLFIQRVREAGEQFAAAGRAHLASLGKPDRQQLNPVFAMEAGQKRLQAFLALHESREFGRAATQLGVTRAAVYDSVRRLENLLGAPLFERTAAGLRGTPLADTVATHVRLAFSLIQHGLDEIASLDGAIRGRVAVGTLPYSRTILIPRAIDRVLQAHPRLSITTMEGSYSLLERSLRNGSIDLIIGATRNFDPSSPLTSEPLFNDELAVICGAHHPLAAHTGVNIEELMDFCWVLPVQSTPARQLFDGYLARHGCGQPRQVIETGSLSVVRGLLLESERLALLSTHQVHLDESVGLLKTLPVRLEGTSRPIGITTRTHSSPSPSARVFIEELRQMAGAVGKRPAGILQHAGRQA